MPFATDAISLPDIAPDRASRHVLLPTWRNFTGRSESATRRALAAIGYAT